MLEKLKSISKGKRTPEEKPKKKKKKRQRSVAVGIVVYRCKICGYTTGSRREIRRHIREAHNKEYSQNKQATKWNKIEKDGHTYVVYSPDYADSPRKSRYHLSEMYERIVIGR